MARWKKEGAEFKPLAVGPPGPAGPTGSQGPTGESGPSPYELAINAATPFVGTEEEWLESLVGPQGEPGDTHVPNPSGESDNSYLSVSAGGLTYGVAPLAVTGSVTVPITDINAPRPSGVVVIWFAEVQPSNAADVDLIIRTDEAV